MEQRARKRPLGIGVAHDPVGVAPQAAAAPFASSVWMIRGPVAGPISCPSAENLDHVSCAGLTAARGPAGATMLRRNPRTPAANGRGTPEDECTARHQRACRALGSGDRTLRIDSLFYAI
jgi:hypothetical protein